MECAKHWNYICVLFFFFKQKTAYEIVSRDWSSDVCSSDLVSISISMTFSADHMEELTVVPEIPSFIGVDMDIDRKSVV